jgi:hypothetical protein
MDAGRLAEIIGVRAVNSVFDTDDPVRENLIWPKELTAKS